MATWITAKRRFLSRVALPNENGCMLWLGSTNHNGYGQFSHRYQNVRAHRFSYEMWVGPIPDGLQLDHLCRVRQCVAPDHLEAVTPRVNTLRGESVSALNAGKTHCPHGHALVVRKGRRRCLVCHRERARTVRTGRRAA